MIQTSRIILMKSKRTPPRKMMPLMFLRTSSVWVMLLLYMLLYINLTLQWLLHSWCCRSLGCSMLHHWPWHFPCWDFGILSCHCVSFSFKWCILTLTIKSVISPIELDYRKKDPITPFNWKDIFNLYENIHRKWEFVYHSFQYITAHIICNTGTFWPYGPMQAMVSPPTTLFALLQMA